MAAKDGNGAESVPPESPCVAPEDEAIARALAAGDADTAVPLLMDRYGAGIHRYCRRMVGSDAEAEDVLQIVFLQAFQAIRRRPEVENVRAWLLGISRHRCLDQLERRRRAPIPVERDELERAVDAEERWEIDVPDARARRHLDECLDLLEARSRQVVLLRFYDQLSYDAISQIVRVKPGTLRVWVARALPSLRKCLEKKAGMS